MNLKQNVISLSAALILASSTFAAHHHHKCRSVLLAQENQTQTNQVVTETSNTTSNTVEKTNGKIYTQENSNIAVTPQQPTFTIKLKSNPSTGYSWFLREYDSNLITPIKRSYQRPEPVATNLIGAPGFELWTFKVKPNAFLVPQHTTIRMIYARPWEGTESSTQVVFRISTQSK